MEFQKIVIIGTQALLSFHCASVLIYMCESERKRKQGRERGNVGGKEEGEREIESFIDKSHILSILGHF